MLDTSSSVRVVLTKMALQTIALSKTNTNP